MTCVFAIGSYFTIPDFPEDVKWLNEQEREWVITRLRGDVGSSGRETPAVKWKDLKVIFTDYKVSSIMFPPHLTTGPDRNSTYWERLCTLDSLYQVSSETSYNVPSSLFNVLQHMDSPTSLPPSLRDGTTPRLRHNCVPFPLPWWLGFSQWPLHTLLIG